MQMQVNLLPPHLRPKPQVRLLPVLIATVLLLSVIATGIYWLVLHLDLSSIRDEIQNQESNIASIERQIRENLWKQELKDSVEKKTSFIASAIEDSILWNPALNLIEKSIIPGVTVTRIIFSGQGTISITAHTVSIKTGVDFWASIQARSGIEDIWVYKLVDEDVINITIQNWSGREVAEDVD